MSNDRYVYAISTPAWLFPRITVGTERDKRGPDAQSWLIGRLNGGIPVPAARCLLDHSHLCTYRVKICKVTPTPSNDARSAEARSQY
ncbi:hypothetical protein A4X06_0g3004 [Tilletia controversa]|uniref:Uncharacterized protein n=2 Tax=Tilletia TaxID=13289 RepID=A0A8X7MVB2_9BASI|nr:hypothetical protein CF328_g2926 [Tilletia controversa]KAE8249926.1 hypothetical protein A4X06_0g3004 [Tilletia controversa]KAE8262257.1 hypothetical protein A4X03_0g2595 [Tilletia caries]